MVTLQILVLSFKVRVLVAQQRGSVDGTSSFLPVKEALYKTVIAAIGIIILCMAKDSRIVQTTKIGSGI